MDASFARKFASRKFALAAATLVSAHWLVAAGKIADGVYSAVLIAVVAAYVTSNVAQRWVERGGGAQ
jgi:hypothetical protein